MDEGLRVDSKWECELLCFGFLRPTVPISMNKLLSLSFLFFYSLDNIPSTIVTVFSLSRGLADQKPFHAKAQRRASDFFT